MSADDLRAKVASLRAGQRVRATYRSKGGAYDVTGDLWDDGYDFLLIGHQILRAANGAPGETLTDVEVIADPPPDEPLGWGAVVTWTTDGSPRKAQRRERECHWVGLSGLYTWSGILSLADRGSIEVAFAGVEDES